MRPFVAAFLLLCGLPAMGGLERALELHLPLAVDLEDHSRARHPIEVVGTVRVETEGAYFGGRMDWLEAPHIALNDRDFAIALWVKETSRSREVGLVEQFGRYHQNQHLQLMLRDNRQPWYGVLGHGQLSPVGVPREQQWMHLVFQYKAGSQQIWINGHLMASMRMEPYKGGHGVTSIGKAARWVNLPAQDFVGYMRDFRIYQRALEVEEIGALVRLRETWGNEGPGAPATAGAPTGLASHDLMPGLAGILPEDKSQPFLEIDGQQIIINGRPGQIYVLQSTADFVAWTPLTWFTNNTGRVVYTDSDPGGAARFYRVMVEGTVED